VLSIYYSRSFLNSQFILHEEFSTVADVYSIGAVVYSVAAVDLINPSSTPSFVSKMMIYT